MTIGFIDPGNWVTNIAAGYNLLWVVTLVALPDAVANHNSFSMRLLCLFKDTHDFD